MVGVICDSFARSNLFTISMTSLQAPVNTAIQYSIGSGRAVGRNNLVRSCLDAGCEWLWFIDDDHAFNGDILNKLLKHEKDITCSLYLQRVQPFAPIVYESFNEENGKYQPLDLTKYGTDDLVQVRAGGTGGMLVRSEVFRALDDPWFEVTEGLGSEDLPFCDKAVDAGFEIWCDLGAKLAHIDPMCIWPTYLEEEKQWAVGFNMANNFNLYVGINNTESE